MNCENNTYNLPGGTKYYKNGSKFPADFRLDFPLRKRSIFPHGQIQFFKFSQDHTYKSSGEHQVPQRTAIFA